MHDVRFEGLPGWEIVSAGLADLAAGRISVASLLVQSVSVRMRQLGIVLPPSAGGGGNAALYVLVAAQVGEGRAHSHYNALRRRLAKFLRTAGAKAWSAGANPPDGDAELH
jgi:hypothetical protein